MHIPDVSQLAPTPLAVPAVIASPELRAADGFAARLQQAIGSALPQPGTGSRSGLGVSLASTSTEHSHAVQASSTGALTLGAMLRAGAPSSTGVASVYGLGGAGFTIDPSAALSAMSAQPAMIVHDATTHASGPLAGRATVAPVEGRRTSEFGNRIHPITGKHKAHHGLDIAAPTGTPVRSVTDGTVIAAGDRGGYGLTVEVDHGNGVTSRYAHMSALDVRVGDRVPVGGTVGAVGSTGASTGPHLHVEVRVNGEPVDPDGIW